VGTLRDLAKESLPPGIVAAYRRGRRRIIRRFGMPVTPRTLPRIVVRTPTGRRALTWVDRRFPEVIARARTRMAIKRYVTALSYAFGPPVEDPRPYTFRDIVLQETLARTDRMLSGLDRRIQGISARSTERLLELERRMAALRQALGELDGAGTPSTGTRSGRAAPRAGGG
jgi:hypothetical protein